MNTPLPDLTPCDLICYKLIGDRAYRNTPLPDLTPCDSPIEDAFYSEIQKCLAPSAEILRQFPCPTPLGRFRLDFLVSVEGRLVGFECDGRQYHDRLNDSARDRAIVEAGHALRIYRIRGHDITHHLHDCFDLIRVRDGALFSERGHHIIGALASREGEHRDDVRAHYWGFSLAVVRWFEREGEDGDSEESDEVIVCWTDKTVSKC